MKFAELIKKHEFEPTFDRLVELYPDMLNSRDGYEKVFGRLKRMRAQSSDLIILVEEVEDDFDKVKYVHVSGYDAIEDIDYAIEYSPWQEWLGMPIMPRCFDNFSEIDILVHCLWELTWSGFDQRQIQGKMRAMMKTVDEIRKDFDDPATKKD